MMKSSFTIHNKSEEGNLNSMYGMDIYRITKRDIDALMEGKILHTVQNGEYAALIVLVDERNHGRFKNEKEEFIGIPRFNAKDEPNLTTQILMSISGWAYERGLDASQVMNHVGFVIQRASQDNPINWKECGRKLVEGDEKDHD